MDYTRNFQNVREGSVETIYTDSISPNLCAFSFSSLMNSQAVIMKSDSMVEEWNFFDGNAKSAKKSNLQSKN